MPQLDQQFPPRFEDGILYPAIQNLDQYDMNGSPAGDQEPGIYFNVRFHGLNTNDVPTLSYGKHAFQILLTPDPGSEYGLNLPFIKNKSRVLFEFKDTLGLVLFSDVTPLHTPDNLAFAAYVWLKEDPLRTYDSITPGYGTLTVVGQVETSDPQWGNTFNIRTEFPILIDLVDEDQDTGQTVYKPNLSPLIFKNPNLRPEVRTIALFGPGVTYITK